MLEGRRLVMKFLSRKPGITAGRVSCKRAILEVRNSKFSTAPVRTFLIQGSERAASISKRWPGTRTSNLPMNSLAAPEMSAKYSSGKQKSHFRMLAVVSSMESSKKGDTPLRRT